MKKIYDVLVKISDIIFAVEKWVLLAAVIVAVAVNFVNVCLRYLAGGGLSYCETLSVCLFMLMVVIGCNIAVKTDSEIKIELLRSKETRTNALICLIRDVLCIAAIIFCLFGLKDTITAVTKNLQKVTPLPIYTYHIYIVMLIGFIMTLLDHIIIALKHVIEITSGTPVEGGCKVL